MYILVFFIIAQYFYRTIADIAVPAFGNERDGLYHVADAVLEGWTPLTIENELSPSPSQLTVDLKTGKIYSDKSSYCKLRYRYNHIKVHSFMETRLKHKVKLIRAVPLYQLRDFNCSDSGRDKISPRDMSEPAVLVLPRTSILDSVRINLRNLLAEEWRTDNRVAFKMKFDECASPRMGDILHVDSRLFETVERCSGKNAYKIDLIAKIGGKTVQLIPLEIQTHRKGAKANTRARRQIQEPAFPRKSYRVEVNENTKVGTVIATIKVVPNSAPGYKILYSIVPSNIGFNIDQVSGAITVTRNLDYDTMGSKKYYSLLVRTSSDTTRLVINVIDLNDNIPVFEYNPYVRTVPEDMMSTASVLEVKATDKDSGVNGEVLYSLKSSSTGGSVFEIDQFSGQIFLGSSRLNREVTAKYEFTVKAEDKGTPKRSAETKVIIIVSDVNDNSPVFSKPEYAYTLSENTKAGSSLLKVTAVDKDEGTNSKISYRIFNDYTNPMVSKFDIHRLTGQITLKQKLDYENQRERVVRFTIEATDAGIPARKGTAFVSISIKDFNDNAPIFRQRCIGYVFENAKKDDVVCTVSASDRDASAPNNEVVYSLKNPPPNLPFKVDFSTGQVKVSGPLDYDDPRSRKFEFTIVASDKGTPMKSSSTVARITLTNVNDNNPVFSKPNYQASIPETKRIGESVIELSATDIDQPSSKEFQFSIVKGNEGNCFSISDRMILVQCSLNYDVRRVYNLTVEVKDSGALVGLQRSSKTYALIRILDANTHAPLFRQTSDVPSIREDAKIGTLVCNITATDLDSGENGRIAYSLINSDGYFGINTVNGEIRTLRKLDSERRVKHELLVMAKDHGAPIRSSTTQLTIAVIDVNDNAPIFQKKVYQVSVKEDIEIGTAITRVRAMDSDSGSNNKAVVYSMPKERKFFQPNISFLLLYPSPSTIVKH